MLQLQQVQTYGKRMPGEEEKMRNQEVFQM